MTTPTGGGNGGTDLVSLGISVDTGGMEAGATSADKIGTAVIKAADGMDKLTASASANSKWMAEANAKYKNKIQLLEEEWRAQQNAIKAEQDANKAIELGVAENTRFISALKEKIATFGMSKTELLAHTAAQLNATEAAAPLINQIKVLTDQYGRHGVAIKSVTELEKERIEFETKAQTIFNAFKTRTLAENAAAEESASIALNAQRQRFIRENLDAEQAAMTTLSAQRRRAIADQAKLEESARTSLNAQRIRAAEDAKKEAVNIAEKEAIEEINWMRKSVQGRIDELKRLEEYQKAGVRPETIGSSFSSAAIKNQGNLPQYLKELEELNKAHKKGHGAANEMAGALDGISFSSARARSEIIVLAHEMVSGNFRRVPGSMMVLAEYTGMARLATSALGLGIAALAVGVGVLGYEFVKGLVQVKDFNDALNRSNAVSGATTSSMTQMAEAAGKVSGEFSAAYEATASLARSGKFTAEQMALIVPVVTDLEHVFSGSLATSIKEFETLVDKANRTGINSTFEITRAVVELNGKYHFLTAATTEQIIKLEAEGKQREASALAIKLYTDEGRRAADAAKEYMGSIERGWHAIKGAVESVGQAMANLGKVNTKQQNLQEAIDKYKAFLDAGRFNGNVSDAAYKSAENSFRAKIALATKALADEQRLAKEASDNQRKQDEASQLLMQRKIDDRYLMLKKGGEREEALARNRLEKETIIAANPHYLDDPKNVQYEADRVEAIMKKHSEKVRQAKGDTARDMLNDQFAQIDAELKLAQDAVADKEKLTEQAIRAGVVKEEEGMKQLRENREAELKALEIWHERRNALIAKNGKIKGINGDREKTESTYAIKKQDINADMNQNEADLVARQTIEWNKLFDAVDRKYEAELDSLDKAIAKQRQHNAEIGKTREQVELARAAKDAAYAAASEQEAEEIRWALAEAAWRGNMSPEQTKFYTEKLDYLDKVVSKHKELVGLHAEGAKLEAVNPDTLGKDLDKQAKQWKTFGDTIAKSLTDAFGKGGKAAGDMLKVHADSQARQMGFNKQLITAQAAAVGMKDEEKRKAQALDQYNAQSAKNRMGEYGGMADAASGFFDEQSNGYKALQTVSQVFHAAELAMTIAELVPKATAAVLNQGTGDPYTAFGRMAAMAAIVSGLGVAISGAGGSPPTAKERQEAAGRGSVLGSGNTVGSNGDIIKYGEQSESIANSLSILEKDSGLGLVHSGQMVASLRSIAAQIGGLAGLVSGKFGADPAMGIGGIKTGTTPLLGSGATNALGFSAKSGAVGGMMLGGPIGALVGAVAGYVAGKITNVKQSIVDSGIALDKATLEQINGSGVNGNTYADVNTRKKFLGIKFSDKTKQVTGELDSELESQFTKIVQGMAKSISLGAGLVGLGGDEFTKKLNSFVVEIEQISFKDMSGEEIEKQLQAIFSKLGDDMAKFAIGGLQEFQKVGEGYFETLTRVASELVQVQDVFAVMGKTLDRTGLDAIKFSQNLIDASGGLEALTSNTKDFVDAFMTESEKIAPVAKSLQAALGELGLSTRMNADQYKELVIASLDGGYANAELYASLIKLAPAMAKVQAAEEERMSSSWNLHLKIAELSKDEVTATRVTTQLRAMELKKMDESLRPLQMRVWALEDEANAAEKAADKMKGLFEASDTALDAVKDAVDAVKETIRQRYDAEKEAIQKNAAAAKEAAQEQLKVAQDYKNAIKSVYDSLDSAMKGAQIQSPEMDESRRKEAQSYLKSIQGTDLTKAGGLKEALSDLAKPSLKMFGSFLEYARDQARTAQLMGGLRNQAGTEVDKAQLQIDAINATIRSIESTSKVQLDALEKKFKSDIEAQQRIYDDAKLKNDLLKGLNTGILSLTQALLQFTAATAAVQAQQAQAAGAASGGAGGVATGNYDAIQVLYKNLLGREGDQEGLNFWTDALKNGVSINQISKEFVESPEYKKLNPSVPGLSTMGTPTTSSMPGVSTIPMTSSYELLSNMRQPESSNAVLVTEMRALRAEVTYLRESNTAENTAIQRDGSVVASKMRRWDGNGIKLAVEN